jgi:hypothetical protein
MNQEKYKVIARANKELLDKVVNYICATFKISVNELQCSLKQYVKNILKEIKYSNCKAVQLRRERKKVREDLDDLERAYCGGENLDANEQGRNTGGRVNTVEIRQIQKIQLREKLSNLLTESLLLEKSLEDNNRLIQKLFKLIPQPQYVSIMEMTYFENMSNTEIAIELSYGIEYVDQARHRGLSDIVKIIKEYVIMTTEVVL